MMKFIRPLSIFHSLAKINLFSPIFIVSSQRPYSGRLNSTMRACKQALKICEKIFDFFKQSEFRKRSIFCFLGGAVLHGAPLSISNMTVEQKVGQLFMIHTHGTLAGEDAQALIKDLHVGGVIYYNWANGLESPQQVRLLSASLQKMAEIPLLIATDQEGGIVARLSSGGFTQFPGNMALAAAGSPALCEDAAQAMGREMLACGVNMNLAPVVDANCEPKNPIIGVRSFGDDPQHVAAFGRAMVEGFLKAGVLPVLKHFPGHGDTVVDTHYGLARVEKSREALEGMELVPFRALSGCADAIMTAHILMPALDPETCATLSYPIMTSLLRQELGFKGVVMTDSMVMRGVLDLCGGDVDVACIKAFEAGCDMILLGGRDLQSEHSELTSEDIARIVRLFQKRVEEGAISMERLDMSVERILALKRKMKMCSEVPFCAHQDLSRKIAEMSITTLRAGAVNFKGRGVCVIAPKVCAAASRFDACFFDGLNPSEEERAPLVREAMKNEAVIVLSYNAWKNGGQQALIQEIAALQKPCAVVALRDPYDVNVVPHEIPVLGAYSGSSVSVEAAMDVLLGRLVAKGQCPVNFSR